MLRSTTAMLNYSRAAAEAMDIPAKDITAEAIAALQADFTWITDVLLNMDGSVLSLEGEPATTEQVAMFLTFVADLAIRDEAAAYSLEIDGAMEIPFFETREAAVAAA
ncbi:hypothetical protein [Kocuria palustris]|uniref:hypothetical protein n=1 Tax=Kocuria palustris TaxID=71999 RepID=UPI003D713E36